MKYKSSQYNVFVPGEEGRHIVHNTLSGALAEVDSENFRSIQEIMANLDGEPLELKDNERSLFESLKTGRFIIPAEDNEISILKLRNQVCRFKTSHLELEIIPTLLCNFSCVYCYETPDKKLMSAETQQHLIDWVTKEANHLDSLHVTWFGGEPLVGFSVMKNLTDQFKKICAESNTTFHTSMPTNGYLLDKKIADQLADMNFIGLQFTLDGDEESHDTFRRDKKGGKTFQVVLENLVHFARKDTDIPISLRVNFNEESFDSVPGLFDKVPADIRSRIKIYFRHIFPAPDEWKNKKVICGRSACAAKKEKSESSPTGNSQAMNEKRAQMITELNRIALEKGFKISGNSQLSLSPPYYCQVDLYNHYVITPDGSFFKCPVEFELGDRVGHFDPEGNLQFNTPKIARWNDKDTFEDKECRDCKLLPVCFGGCQFHIMNGKKQCPTQRYDFEERLKLTYQEQKLKR
jgi:uncharacterized protein